MKKLKFILPISLLSIFISGCGAGHDLVDPYEETPQQPVPHESASNVENYTFYLNEEEVQIYERLKDQLSTSVLEDVSPFSIAKIHIQAGIDEEWQAEYAMFSQVGLETSLDQWIMYVDEQKSEIEELGIDFNEHLKVMVDQTFSLLEQGEFIENSETEAHILFENIYGDPMSFSFIKNEAGIWEVSFAPVQFVD